MGRKKSRPIRSSILSEVDAPGSSKRRKIAGDADGSGEQPIVRSDPKPYFVSIDKSHWPSEEHLDIAEIVLRDVEFTDGVIDTGLVVNSFIESNFTLRFCLGEVDDGCFKLGHWPVVRADSMFLEYVVSENVVFCGVFDGPDEGVSGLAHLLSLKLMGLRLVLGDEKLDAVPPFRVRVEVLHSAFDACKSLLEIARQPWRKSMMNVMSWLRPEVTTSDARYGSSQLRMEGMETDEASSSRKDAVFDADSFYEAIKPSKEEPMLEDEHPDLLPQLRPYQRRAAYWMVQRD